MKNLHTLALAATLAVAAGGVQADTFTISAVPQLVSGTVYGDTAQVGTKGQGNSQDYIDVEGSGNGAKYESFGVIDFNGDGIPEASDANLNPIIANLVSPNITLGLTDASFGSTKPGTLDFFLSDSSTPLYNLAYDTTDTSNSAGVGSQLGTLYSLGSYAYTSTKNTTPGALDAINLTVPGGAAQDYFRQQLNNGGNIRFVVTAPGAVSTVGSFQGATNGAPPTLTFTAAVPEANTPALLLVGLLSLAAVGATRRRKSA